MNEIRCPSCNYAHESQAEFPDYSDEPSRRVCDMCGFNFQVVVEMVPQFKAVCVEYVWKPIATVEETYYAGFGTPKTK